MASTNNGDQIITFKYQQEGTAESFNKLIHGVIPTGIISGGDLIKVSNSQINIAPLEMVMSDGNVTVNVQTRENAIVNVDKSLPYIIAKFNWANLTNNFVSFESASLSSLSSLPNALILGKCEFIGTTLEAFDYTRKTWSSTYYNNDFLYSTTYGAKSPSFWVTPFEMTPDTMSLGFYIGKGRGVINGVDVELDNPLTVNLVDDDSTSHWYFQRTIQYGRTDIVVLNSDKTVDYIMGADENVMEHKPPIFPSNGLVLAKFKFTSTSGVGIQIIYGSNIENMYNNNYICGSGTVGKKVGNTVINTHTLYL